MVRGEGEVRMVVRGWGGVSVVVRMVRVRMVVGVLVWW